MKSVDLISNLQYIADSPPQEFGGFHKQVIKTAKAALKVLAKETQNYISVNWKTFIPIEGNPYCVSCKEQIAQDIKEELEKLAISGAIFIYYGHHNEWQSFWKERGVK